MNKSLSPHCYALVPYSTKTFKMAVTFILKTMQYITVGTCALNRDWELLISQHNYLSGIDYLNSGLSIPWYAISTSCKMAERAKSTHAMIEQIVVDVYAKNWAVLEVIAVVKHVLIERETWFVYLVHLLQGSLAKQVNRQCFRMNRNRECISQKTIN